LVLSAILAFIVLVAGFIGFPIYLFVSLGAALAIAQARSLPKPPSDTDFGDLARTSSPAGRPRLPLGTRTAYAKVQADDTDW
jgi:hypothetical protein